MLKLRVNTKKIEIGYINSKLLMVKKDIEKSQSKTKGKEKL